MLDGFSGGVSGKEFACQCRRCGFDPWVGKIPLEREMATHSSVTAWKTPWTEEPGGLQSMGSQERSWLSMHRYTHTPKLTSFRAIGNSHHQDQQLFPNVLLSKSREADIDKEIKLYKISQFSRHRTWVILHCWLNQFLSVLNLHTIHYIFHY